jgi:hypothetical protein
LCRQERISFPALSCEVNYENNEAIIIDIYSIEKSTFNTKIADAAFIVPLPQNMHVWDSRYNDKRPVFTRLETDIDNVMPIIGDYYEIQQSQWTWKRLIPIVVINAIFLLSLIAWQIYKRHKQSI